MRDIFNVFFSNKTNGTICILERWHASFKTKIVHKPHMNLQESGLTKSGNLLAIVTRRGKGKRFQAQKINFFLESMCTYFKSFS